jgi:anti-sigma B factor antagonist
MAATHGGHWLEREDIGDVTVVRVKVPRLGDDDTTKDIFHQIYTLISEVGRRNVVLNLAGPDYLASLALGKLVMVNRKAEAAHGRLALCHLSAMAAEALEVTHLAELFSIYATELEAVKSFST